ncbi:MAG: hypothetical protein J6P44_02215 [Bacteroidales bacterium]|nr:hypothetical protein [Bacteroidales bacterium]
MKKELLPITKKEYDKILGEKNKFLLYCAPIPANIGYSMVNDVVRAVEKLNGRVQQSGIKIDFQLKKDFNEMFANAKRFEKSALHTSNTYNKLFEEQNKKGSAFDRIQSMDALMCIWESYTRRLYDLLLKADSEPVIYEKIWNFFATIEGAGVIDWEDPDFSYLPETRKEKNDNATE